MDIIKYIKEDLKRSGIKKFTFEFVNYSAGYSDDKIFKIDNGILYVFALSSLNNRPAILESLEMKAEINPSNGTSNVFKFHNDIYRVSNVRELQGVKVKFVRE